MVSAIPMKIKGREVKSMYKFSPDNEKASALVGRR